MMNWIIYSIIGIIILLSFITLIERYSKKYSLYFFLFGSKINLILLEVNNDDKIYSIYYNNKIKITG